MESEQRVIWRKPARSGTGNGGGGDNCVEVATLPGRVLVRDSKDPAGPVLAVPPADWRGFLAVVGR